MIKDCGRHGTTKDCSRHGTTKHCHCRRHSSFWQDRPLISRLLAVLLFLIIIALFVILVVYLALRPHRPRFYVQDAIIRQWNVTDDTLTSSLQFTVITRNPNDRIGVYYDRISAYASYLGQQVTPYGPLTPFYQGHNDVNVLSPILYGEAVPLAPFIADHLRAEQQNGVVTVNLRIWGRIRWKVGTWISGHYHLNVNCYAFMGFTRCCDGSKVPLQAGTRCDVDI